MIAAACFVAGLIVGAAVAFGVIWYKIWVG